MVIVCGVPALVAMNDSARLHGLAASARIANLPSVVSNVWLGCALAFHLGGGVAGGNFSGKVWLLVLAGVGLYLAGNFHNDWEDRDWDAVHRPERALPRKLFPAGLYLTLAVVCGALGLCAAAAVSLWCLVVALIIGFCIVVYTRVHKHVGWAVIPMGLCRALLPVLGFVRPAGLTFGAWVAAIAMLMPCAIGLFCHIAGLSLSARNESLAGPPAGARRFAAFLFPAAAAAMFVASWLSFKLPLWSCVIGLIPYTLWIVRCLTVFRYPVSRKVASLLAGIPLVDWIVLLPLALRWDTHGLSLLPVLCLLTPPLAFLAGKRLQRFAPAT